MQNYDIGIHNYSLAKELDICPYCNKGILPNYINYSSVGRTLVVLYTCPICNEVIVVKYNEFCDKYYINNIYPAYENKEEFDETITMVSDSFCNIYNQAKTAENMGLNEICGIGYRKALEFLIKDYCKLEYPEEANSIEVKPLKQCIDKYIQNIQIKDCATMATYLGNDETHYIKKWVDKDISDLKKLIKLTLAWIHLNELTKKYKSDMLINK